MPLKNTKKGTCGSLKSADIFHGCVHNTTALLGAPFFFFCSITAKCFLDVREGLAALLIMIVLTELSLMSLLAFSSGVIMNKSLESAMCLAQSACTSTLRVCVTGRPSSYYKA